MPNKGYFKSLAPQEGHGINIKESGKALECKLTNGKSIVCKGLNKHDLLDREIMRNDNLAKSQYLRR